MLDPHVWLSFDNAILIAQAIAQQLSLLDSKNTKFYQNNLQAVVTRLKALKNYANSQLKDFAGRSFYVYHPAFGYFAHANNLKQAAIELGGREPSAAHLAKLVKVMRQEQVKVIFVQVQFNPNAMKALARETKANVVELDPLAYNLEESFKKITDSLVKGFSSSTKVVK
jgi:zinc transport system substrate-binding protein